MMPWQQEQKGPNSQTGCFYNVLDHFSLKRSVLIKFIAYFGKITTKQGNEREMNNLWRHPYVILHLSNSSQHKKVSLYLP